MTSKTVIVGLGAGLVSCLVSIITTIMTMNCASKKDWGCARGAGFTALGFTCVAVLACGFTTFVVSKH